MADFTGLTAEIRELAPSAARCSSRTTTSAPRSRMSPTSSATRSACRASRRDRRRPHRLRRRPLHGRDRQDPLAGQDGAHARAARRMSDGRHDHRATRSRRGRAANPGVPVVTYVNSSAEVKAEATSASPRQRGAVVRSLGAERILFAPDRNLGSWVAARCPTSTSSCGTAGAPRTTTSPPSRSPPHAPRTRRRGHRAPRVPSRGRRPRRRGAVHLPDAVDAAASDAGEFVVDHRGGLIHALEKAAPASVRPLDPRMLCPNMKVTTLEKVRDRLADLSWRSRRRRGRSASRALGAVERMVAIG